jgi:hypothetical protein
MIMRDSSSEMFPPRTAYEAYLQSPQWRALAARLKAAAGQRCTRMLEDRTGNPRHWTMERCPNTTDLQVHHLTYDRLGHELDSDLEVLCKRCHLLEHVLQTRCTRCGGDCFEGQDAGVRDQLDMAMAEGYTTLGEVLYWLGVSPGDWALCDYCAHMEAKDC